MKLKDCPCCKRPQTTKNSQFLSRFTFMYEGLMFNCLSCGSSFVIMENKLLKKAKASTTEVAVDSNSLMAQDIIRRLG